MSMTLETQRMLLPIIILFLFLFLEKFISNVVKPSKHSSPPNPPNPVNPANVEINPMKHPSISTALPPPERFTSSQSIDGECSALTNIIRDAVGDKGTCVFDYDNTMTGSTGKISRCTKACVKECPNVAINTYNSAMTYDSCCTNPVFLEAGLCPYGQCIVPKKHWAHREGMYVFKLNDREIGNVFTTGAKTMAMDIMGLDKKDTILIDDRMDNIMLARDAGYKVLHVDGVDGL